MKKYNADRSVVIRIPLPMLEDFKNACNLNYQSRSEAVRELIRRYIQENKDKIK